MASLGHRTDDQSRVQSRSSNCDQTKVDDRNEDGANAFVLDDSDDGIGLLDNNRPNNNNDVLPMNDIGRPSQRSPHEKDFMSELELSIQQIPRSKFFRNLVCKFKLDNVGQQKVLGKIEQRLREKAYEFRKENNNPNVSDINVGIGKLKRPRAISECSDVIRSPDNNNRNEYLERNDIRSNRRMNRGKKKFPQKLMDVMMNEEDSDAISWLPDGRSFIIKNKKFESDILGKYFQAMKFKNFDSTLKRWGFTRVTTRGPEMGYTYFHNLFLRDNPELCWQIKTTKNVSARNHWMNMYNRLVQYKEREGHTRVPQKFQEDPKLGRWVSNQRQFCKRQDRIDLLNDTEFDWGLADTNWMGMYNRLVQYKSKHGNTLVPKKFQEDPKLGRWVSNQRDTCKQQDRIDLLNDIGFEWNLAEISDLEVALIENSVNHGDQPGTTPSKAISIVQLAQGVIFPDKCSKSLLLSNLDGAYLDSLGNVHQKKEAIEKTAVALMTSIASGFDMNMTMKECREAPQCISETDVQNVEKAEGHNATTLTSGMELVMVLVEKQLVQRLIDGTIVAHIRENKRVALWAPLPRENKNFYCVGAIGNNEGNDRVHPFVIADNLAYMVDVVSGDMVRFKKNKDNIFKAESVLNAWFDGVKRNKKYNICCKASEPNQPSYQKRVARHHAILYALGVNLYQITNKWFVFRGYLTIRSNGRNKFDRPLDWAADGVNEELDADGDPMMGICMTDGDHTLGFWLDSCFTLHLLHHQVNTQLHHTRTRLGHWGHPYSHQVYVDLSSRQCPNYFHNLPSTLGSGRIVAEEVQNLYKKK